MRACFSKSGRWSRLCSSSASSTSGSGKTFTMIGNETAGPGSESFVSLSLEALAHDFGMQASWCSRCRISFRKSTRSKTKRPFASKCPISKFTSQYIQNSDKRPLTTTTTTTKRTSARLVCRQLGRLAASRGPCARHVRRRHLVSNLLSP